MGEIKKSQNFLNDKFESLLKSVEELKGVTNLLRSENARLQQRVGSLESKVALVENDMEYLRQYLRRDMLEIHGIPVTTGENTNNIVMKVVSLIEPEFELADQETQGTKFIAKSEFLVQKKQVILVINNNQEFTNESLF